MCRMMALAAERAGDLRPLLRAFPEQARRSLATALPETHGHGWGLVVASGSGIRSHVTSIRPVFEDEGYGEAVDALGGAGPMICLVHARQASCGGVAPENTHPFVRSGWAFMHNGTIEGPWTDVESRCVGSTDSERLFQRVLDAASSGITMREAMRSTLMALEPKRFTSATVLATDGRVVLGFRRVGEKQEDGGTPSADGHRLLFSTHEGVGVVCQETTGVPGIGRLQEVPLDGEFSWTPPEAPRIEATGSPRPRRSR